MASPSQVLLLYRQILRAAKHFPSVKRNLIIEDIRIDFRQHRNLSDPEAIQQQLAVGIRSLEQLEGYAGIDKHAHEWTIALKGSCN